MGELFSILAETVVEDRVKDGGEGQEEIGGLAFQCILSENTLFCPPKQQAVGMLE